MCVHLVCMCVHEVMHGVCLSGAWHGIVRHKMGTVCKTHTHWPKHVKHVQLRVNPNIGTHLSPIQHKMPLEHFVKHLACNTALHEWTMHEHIEKCLNTWLKCHKGPTQIHTNQMGYNPIKILKQFSQNQELQPFFEKIPNFRTLRKFLHNLSGKDEKNVKSIPLRFESSISV